jgi:hypothetical protein
MAGDHIETLHDAREKLVEDRRTLAASLAGPYMREMGEVDRERFIRVQRAINAVDAAIEDERSLNRPDAQQPRWDTVAPDNDPLGE